MRAGQSLIDKGVETAVMFADIAESTRAYENLGDTRAEEAISGLLDELALLTERHGGTVVKTMGDALMCRFDSADSAVYAACDMCEMGEVYDGGGLHWALRIGLHYGRAISKSKDVFGDAVNVAARMAGLARAGQILTTRPTVDLLNRLHRGRCRLFDEAAVRGKRDAIAIYEVVWERDDVTCIIDSTLSPKHTYDMLELSSGFGDMSVSNDSNAVLLGRGPQCDLIVQTDVASRVHARIFYQRGKFTLADQSTNGTYVRVNGSEEVFLRREEMPLPNSGIICLGRPLSQSEDDLITFRCRLGQAN